MRCSVWNKTRTKQVLFLPLPSLKANGPQTQCTLRCNVFTGMRTAARPRLMSPQSCLPQAFMSCSARLPAMRPWRWLSLFPSRRGARVASGRSLCFCGPAGDAQEHGELYGHGLAALGIAPERMLMVAAAKEKDLLWTLEEAVASGAFGAVVGGLGARERLYGFAASRRLKLRAAATGTPLFLLRHRVEWRRNRRARPLEACRLAEPLRGRARRLSPPGTAPLAAHLGAHGRFAAAKLGDGVRWHG